MHVIWGTAAVKFLVLGGTAWLGREVSLAALRRGHDVTCLARGDSGDVAPGASLVAADRERHDAYENVKGDAWDAVVDVSWQPGFVRGAIDALAARVGVWIYVSSCSVYADTAAIGADETAEVVAPITADEADISKYGEAKVACELAVASALQGRAMIVRPGLIGGPGDTSDRSGAWVARAARDPDGPLLVPATPDAPTQVCDVRDLAAWLVDCAARRTTGTFNAVGPVVPFAEWLDMCRAAARHTGPLEMADAAWLLERGVRQYMGPESLTMWIADVALHGFSTRSGAAAAAAGLEHRPRRDLIADVLQWERQQGLDRPREAGLSWKRENELLTELGAVG